MILDDLLIRGDWLEENDIKNDLYKLYLNNLRIKLRKNNQYGFADGTEITEYGICFFYYEEISNEFGFRFFDGGSTEKNGAGRGYGDYIGDGYGYGDGCLYGIDDGNGISI